VTPRLAWSAYAAWIEDRLVLDTATLNVGAAVSQIEARIDALIGKAASGA